MSARQSFVELLYADAPAEAYEQVVRDAAAGGAASDVLVALRSELDTALRVREQRQRLRRREAELSALYETAHDLTAIRDVDAVLQAITRRARQLLSADITYLSLNDHERGDSFIRVTDGSVSASFRGLRLPLGTGLLGLVAQTGEPYATDDYAGDQRFVHRSVVDEAVDDEGIRAILGVPLQLDGHVIGTLCAAHRSARPFPADEVALLRSFAAHAAIALENARLFEELQSVGDQMRAHSESIEQAARAHDRLTQVLLHSGEGPDGAHRLRALAEVVAEVLPGTVWVVDADGRTSACSDPDAPDPPTEAIGPGQDESASAAGVGRTERTVDASGAPVWLTPARAGSEHLATLVLRGSEAVGPADRRTLERAAVVAALVVLFDRSEAEAEDRVRGEVLDDLLTASRRHPTTVRERGLRHGADLDDPHAVLVARVPHADRLRATAVATRIAAAEGGLAGRHDGDVVLILPGDDALALARQVHERLTDPGVVVTLGVVGPVSGVDAYAGAWAEARQCVVALLALGRAGEVADPAGLGRCSAPPDRTSSRRSWSEPSAPSGTTTTAGAPTWWGTLEAWYAAGGGGVAGAGRRLHVHPNTVTQRLDRVGQLLGEGWRDPERGLEVRLALRLVRLQAGAG